MMSLFIFVVLTFAQLAFSKIVTLYWNITWVTAAPDGFARPVIGINGQWPCPELRAQVGDRVVVTINNQLGNQSTSLHWHGIHQKGTTHMDGSVAASQCAVPPGKTFTYDWTVSQLTSLFKIAFQLTRKGGSSWNILVSFAQCRPIS
jgi:iron transport multicopper oxidase